MNEALSLRAAVLVNQSVLLRAGRVFIVVGLLAWLAIRYADPNGWLVTIWAPDAVLLACLLRTPLRQWGIYIFAAFIACSAVNFMNTGHLGYAMLISGFGNLTVIIPAFMLAGSGRYIDLTRRADLIKFFLIAGLCGPAISAVLVSLCFYLLIGAASLAGSGNWFLEHALGIMIVTPPLLVVSSNDLRQAFSSKDRAGLLTALAIVALTAAIVFWQSSYPALFLIFPTIIFAAFRSSFVGASLGTLFTAIIGIALTLSGHGPLMLIQGGFSSQILILQIFLATAFFSSIPIAVALIEAQKFQQEMILARQDLTEQNRLLQLAEKTAKLGHWRHDLATSKVFWSDETYRIHGREKSSYVPSPETVLERYHPDDHEKILRASENAISGLGETNIVLRVMLPNNETRYLETLTRCEFDENGNPRILFGVSHDITAAKRTEQALIVALDEAQRANRAKSDFLASMSHELRTPLNAVIGFSELLLHHPKEHLSELQTEYLGYVLRSGNQLLQLVKDVLDLSTIEAGRLHVSIQPVDLRDIMEELEATLIPFAGQKGITYEPAALPKTIPTVRADHGRLLQVLINLGTNAIKYNKPNGSLHISAMRTADAHVRIAVRDSGNGIPVNRQNELFQPFNRLGFEGSSIEGTGIGLSICKQLIELMGGVIGFTSKPGIGSIFWIEVDEA